MSRGLKAEFELVPRNEDTSFALREFRLPAFQSPWHFHPEAELTYIINGRGRRFVGDHIAPFGPGDLVLVGSNLPHYWHNDPAKAGEETLAHSLVIQFREDCLGADFLDRPEMERVRNLLRRASRGLQFRGPARDMTAGLMAEMQEQDALGRLVGFLRILQALVESRDKEPLSSGGFSPSLDHLAGERITKAYQHVFAHFTERLDYRQIARSTGMSPSAFCHYFRKVTGRTLSDFVCEVRIGHARKLLIESTDGVAEIAYASGFDSLSNFNRCFRDQTGASPSQFRAEHVRSNAANQPHQAWDRQL